MVYESPRINMSIRVSMGIYGCQLQFVRVYGRSWEFMGSMSICVSMGLCEFMHVYGESMGMGPKHR